LLIICNNPPTKQRLVRLFEHEGYRYELFEQQDADYDELNKKLKNGTGTYHALVILDDTRLNGIQLAKNLEHDQLTQNYLMIMISANHKSDNYILARSSGIDHYLLEPFESIDVIKCLLDYFPKVKRTAAKGSDLILHDPSILIGEDNDINIKVAETIFSNLGLSIDVAKNGSEVVKKIKEKPYDIVFMDLVMPDMDGIQATVEIRGSGYQMPIVAMTATASTKTKSKAIASGMNDYIVKPVKTDTVRNILLKWFA
jgi:CheY-like chemotaxis protein